MRQFLKHLYVYPRVLLIRCYGGGDLLVVVEAGILTVTAKLIIAISSAIFAFMLAKKRASVQDREPIAASVPADTEARLCALGNMARDRLKPWAAVKLPNGILPGMRAHEVPLGTGLMMPKSPFFKEFHKCGEHEGLGVLLLIAKLGLSATGCPTQQACSKSLLRGAGSISLFFRRGLRWSHQRGRDQGVLQ